MSGKVVSRRFLNSDDLGDASLVKWSVSVSEDHNLANAGLKISNEFRSVDFVFFHNPKNSEEFCLSVVDTLISSLREFRTHLEFASEECDKRASQ